MSTKNPLGIESTESDEPVSRDEFNRLVEYVETLERCIRAEDAQERLVDYINELVNTIESQDEIITKKDDIIERQDDALERKDVIIERHDEMLNKKDEIIEEQHDTLDRKDEIIDGQHEIIEEQEETIEGQGEILDELQDDIDGVTELIEDAIGEELEEYIDNETATVELRGDDEGASLTDLWIADIPVGKIIDSNRQRSGDAATKAAEALETADGPDPENVAENEQAARQIAQTVGEHLTMQPAAVCDNVNQERTQFILKNIKHYAKKGRSGWLLEPSKIRSVLYAKEETPAAAHDQTIARVRETFADFCDDEVEIVEVGRQKIVQFSDDIVKRCTNLKKIRERCPSLVCDAEKPVSG